MTLNYDSILLQDDKWVVLAYQKKAGEEEIIKNYYKHSIFNVVVPIFTN